MSELNDKGKSGEVMTSLISGFRKIEKVSLVEVFNGIKNGVYQNRIDHLRKLMKDGMDVDGIKRALPAFTPCCIVEGGTGAKHIVTYNQLMILDFDNIQVDKYSEVFEAAQQIPYTYMAFRSPRGNGIKIIVPINSGLEDHAIAFNKVGKYYSEKLNIPVDASGKNPNRLCYVSGDPEAYINDGCETFPGTVEKQGEISFPSHSLDIEKWDEAIRWVEKKHEYVPGDRNNYIHYLSCCCNRLGLKYDVIYDKILIEYPHENPQEISRSIDSGYKNKEEYNTCSNIAKIADIAVLQSEKHSLETPYIPIEIYSQLPDILIKSTDAMDDHRQKDVFLTGALGVLSGCFNSLYGYYDGEQVYSNLYSYVSAPAASGKGALTHSRTIALKYHDYIRSQTQTGKAESLLFIPGNSSSAALLAHLNENEGRGIFFETEADTISNSMKQEWGNFSDILRKAFHHEPVTSTRKLNREYYQLDNPRLSVVLSGTPNQVQNLIQSAENGLFSRFLFYTFNPPIVWRNVGPNRKINNLKGFFNEIGEEIYEIIRRLDEYEAIEFKLSEEQWNILNITQEDLLMDFTSEHGDNAASMVKRMGLMWFRIAMILTALRSHGNISENEGGQCSDLDFEISGKLMKTYKIHILSVYKSLPKQAEPIRNPKMDALYKCLPDEFSRKDLLAYAKELNIPERTADGFRETLQKQGVIEFVKLGIYRKVK